MTITYQPASGPAVPIKGIFDELYRLAQGDPPSGVEVTQPAVFVRLADLPVHPDNDEPLIIITGAISGNGTYRVTERLSAGMGAMLLALRKES